MTRSESGSAHAGLRAVRPPEVPFDGELADGDGDGDGGPAYRVAADGAPHELWAAQPGGHLLAAVDVDRVDGRTMLILPRLRQRLDAVAEPLGLSAGQAVTLLVSVLRGASAAATAGWSSGEWWLAEDGRPLLVPSGAQSVGAASAAVIDRVDDRAVDTIVRGRVTAAVGDPGRLPALAPRLEDELFALAAAEPLPLRYARAESAARSRVPHARERRGQQGAVSGAIGRLFDADLVARVTAASTALERGVRRLRTRVERGGRPRASRKGAATRDEAAAIVDAETPASQPRRRGRLVIVAAAAVALTLALGLGWPESEDPARGLPAPSETTGRAEPMDAATGSSGGGEGASLGGAPLDPAASTSAGSPGPDASASRGDPLVEELAACWQSGDLACRAAVLERPDAALPDGVVTSPTTRVVTLLDDLGGVEVLRVEDASGALGPQIVVVVTTDDERLVRDVYDVADQP